MKRLRLLCLLLGVVAAGPAPAEEAVIELEGTTVIGNQELPKVLYIVPWQKSELPDVADLPLNRLVEQAIQPVERDSFQRQVKFYYELAR